MKSSRPLWIQSVNTSKSCVRCTWQNRTSGEIFLPGRSAKLGSAFSELPGVVVDLRYGCDLASAAGRKVCWKTLHAERPELVIGSPPSRRHSPWIKDEREARLQGNQTLELLLCRLSMANRAWSTLSPRTSMASFLVGPGLLESSERTARCGCGAMRSALVWIGGALAFLKDGGWGERQSTQRTGWMTSMNDLACELSEMQGLDVGKRGCRRA